MQFLKQKLYLQIIFIILVSPVSAQESWPTPEVEQMYHNAQQYVARGDFAEAVITYKEAIAFAPDKLILYKGLANAFLLSGNFAGAEKTLVPVCNKTEADPTCFNILAASQAAQNDRKKAATTLKKGLERFPQSGLLYHEQGKIFAADSNQEAAIKAWLNGIASDPGYGPNYREATLSYLSTSSVLWGLLYGEIYLDIPHDTAGDEDINNKLFAGYKTFFEGFATGETPQYGKIKKTGTVKTFEDAVLKVYAALTPVVSDGITEENLTMVRTRFLMDWFSGYGSDYPFSLFSYEDSLVSYGRFDIWNEWMFGKAESISAFDAWDTFHDGAIGRTLQWHTHHPLRPLPTDNYNKGDIKGMFKK